MPNDHQTILYPARAGFLSLLLSSTLLLAVSAGKLAIGSGSPALQFVTAAAGIALGGSYSVGRLANMRLDANGIVVRDLFRQSTFAWDEFEGFRADTTPHRLLRFIPIPQSRVVLEFAPESDDDPGSWAALRFSYGMKAEELATELDFWLEHRRGPNDDERAELFPQDEPEDDETVEDGDELDDDGRPIPPDKPTEDEGLQPEDEDGEEFDISPIVDDDARAKAEAEVAAAKAELEALRRQRIEQAEREREAALEAARDASAQQVKDAERASREREKELKRQAKAQQKALIKQQKEQQKLAKQRQKELLQQQKEQQKAREQARARKQQKKPKAAAASRQSSQRAVHRRDDEAAAGDGINWSRLSAWVAVIIGVGIVLAGTWFFLLRDIVQGDDLKRDDIISQIEQALPPGDKADAVIECPEQVELSAGAITTCDVLIDGEVVYFMEAVQQDADGSTFEVRKIDLQDADATNDLTTGVEAGDRSGQGTKTDTAKDASK